MPKSKSPENSAVRKAQRAPFDMSKPGDAARTKTQGDEGRRDSERPLDVSDLSPAAQARIQAAQDEAEQIVADGRQMSEIVAIREKLPWAKSRPEPLLAIVAQDRERVPRRDAAQHVFAEVAHECLKEGGLANESRLKSIGEQLCTQYGCSPGWLKGAMRLWRVAALRNQAIELEGGQARFGFILRTSARLMQAHKVHLIAPVHSAERQQSAARHPRGVSADMDRHRAIAEVVSKHAPDWRTNPSAWKKPKKLAAIAANLDTEAENDSHCEPPRSWKKPWKTQALHGTPAQGWVDALKLASRKLLIDEINSHLKMVLKREAKTG